MPTQEVHNKLKTKDDHLSVTDKQVIQIILKDQQFQEKIDELPDGYLDF